MNDTYVLLSISTGCLFGMGVYMLLRRNMVKLIIGLILVSHAVNLFVLLSGDLTIGGTPVLEEGASQFSKPVSDPVPQALILTAIVIGFGLLAFAIVLIKRIHKTLDTEDLHKMRNTDKM